MAEDWTKLEVEFIVKDYFEMLILELEQKKYNKTAHRKNLIPLLNGRAKSIEFKHRNISAVLSSLGLPFIKGYKPLDHSQGILKEEVADFIKAHKEILELYFDKFANTFSPKTLKEELGFEYILDNDPIISILKESEPTYRPIKVNYLEKEQNNRNLGIAGEEFVIAYEKWRLINEGKISLSEKIEWISKDLGDGAGYDILSKNTNGSDRFIEVKTTKLIKETPIYLTKNEISFATTRSDNFFLYRVFNFDTNPQIFIKQGNYKNFCNLEPISYKGSFYE